MKKNAMNEPARTPEDDEMLSRLAERVERAVTTIEALRKERDTLKERVTDLEEQVRTRSAEAERFTGVEEEVEQLRSERTEVRSRIENILSSLERLEE